MTGERPIDLQRKRATHSARSIITVCFIGAILSGCASPNKQMSLDDMDASLTRNEAAAVRLYPGKSISEVRKASRQVLYLLDPQDIRFDVQDDGLMATRWSTYYAVFSVGFGRDWYSVNFTQDSAGTKARFGFTGQMNAGLIVSPIPESFKPKIPISAHQNSADFKLFHDRVEYLLGLRHAWETCALAKKTQANPDKTLFLCDSLGLENHVPQPPARG